MKIILFLLFFISSITFDNLSIIFTDTNDNKNQNIGSYDERLNPGTTIEFVCQNSSPEQNYNVIIYKNNNTDTLSVYSNTINHKSYWKIDYTLTINDTAYKIYHLNYEKHGKIYMNNKLPDIHDDVSNIDDIYYYNRKLIFSSTQPGNYNINVYSLSGELLYHNISIIFKGKNNIDIPNYKNIVILKIIGDNRTMTKKIFNI